MDAVMKFWREPTVLSNTGLKRATMRAMVARGEFPAPVKLSIRCSAWVADECLEWMRSRVAISRNAAS